MQVKYSGPGDFFLFFWNGIHYWSLSSIDKIYSYYSLLYTHWKLKLPYFGHLLRRVNSLEKALMLGNIKGKRRRVRPTIRWLDSITDSVDMNLSKLWKIVKDRENWHAVVHRVTKNETQLRNQTTTTVHTIHFSCVHFDSLWSSKIFFNINIKFVDIELFLIFIYHFSIH